MDIFINNIETISEVTSKVVDALKEIDNSCILMSIVGTAVDEWGRQKGMTSEETVYLFTALAEVAPCVHEVLGTF